MLFPSLRKFSMMCLKFIGNNDMKMFGKYLCASISNLCDKLFKCSNFWQESQDELPPGQLVGKLAFWPFVLSWEVAHIGGRWDLFAHFWCKIPVEMFAEDEMHLTKESLWNFFNGDNPEVTKLTRNLFKGQFMHHIQIQIEIKKLHRWIFACCSKQCFLSCFWDAKIRSK